MRAVDIVQLAVGSLRQRKLRAALPVVGVAVGSFVLIASLAIGQGVQEVILDRKSTRLNSSHVENSYAVSCLKKKSHNAAAFSAAARAASTHVTLHSGDLCPECRRGKVYRLKEPATLLRLVGHARLE